MQESLDAGDLQGARRHAEHVLNVLALDQFGDMDGSGLAENPGDDVGVRRYVEQATASSAVLTSESAALALPSARLLTGLAGASEPVSYTHLTLPTICSV